MLVSIWALLPLIASSFGAVLPIEERSDLLDLMARQRGGTWGNWERPTGRPTGAPTGSPAADAQTPAAPAVSSQPGVAGQDAAAGASEVQPAPVASSAGSEAAAAAGEGTAAAEPAAADSAGTAGTAGSGAAATGAADTAVDSSTADTTGSGASTDTDAAGTGSTDANTTGSGTETSGSGAADGGSGDGPAGTGWDTEYNPADLTTYKAAGLQWWYNWQLKPTVESLVEYVPMVKFGDNVTVLPDVMGSWPSGTQYVLSFNEPDMDPKVGGTSMSAPDAAKKHRQAVEILAGRYKLSSPGVSQHGLDWIGNWVTECEALGGCEFDFTAVHFYGTNADVLIDHIKTMHAKLGKKVWVTEWACHEFGPPKVSCNAEEAETFMKSAIEWFRGEGADIVTRWAWFGAFRDMSNWHKTDNMDASRIANSDGTINELGELYLSL